MLPAERQKQVLSLLTEQGAVRVDELSRMLGVSEMTVHRDLDKLANQGRLYKVRGGAVLPTPSSADQECYICHRVHRSRTPMVLRMSDGSHRHTCCPHCGLMALLDSQPLVTSALVSDFLYSRMVNCRAASYVIGAQISFCCTPTILAFERREDAQRFQRGFGGQVSNLAGTLAALENEMRLGAR